MDDSLFHVFWRMDWGFGNPNKTAALIVSLMIAVWGLSYVQKWAFWLALSLSTGLGACLVLTLSRGALVGALAGFAFVTAWLPRPYPKQRMIAVILSCVVLAIFALAMDAEHRYVQGLSTEDRSIDNRLLIWQQVPSMIHDAPNGWGLGRSGDAYMQWYQPITRGEGYRTLVNSHLTALVELNWWGRILYVFSWIAILTALWPSRDYRWFSIPFAIWIAFFVCATFSTVAESRLLWGIPIGAIILVLVVRILKDEWPKRKIWLVGGSSFIVLIGATLADVFYTTPPSTIFCIRPHLVTIGSKTPKIWVVTPDRNVLGEHYGHEIRRSYEADGILQQTGVGVADTVVDAPINHILVFSGQIPKGFTTRDPSRVILIDPTPPDQDILQKLAAIKTDVIVGEYSQNRAFWREQTKLHPSIKLHIIEVVEEYIPDWMQEIANILYD